MTCVMIGYGLFDIVMVTYLGNEIMMSRDRLSYCFFESNWCEQTLSCLKLIIIMTELLKKPKKLVVGMLFTLNLDTFTFVSKLKCIYFYSNKLYLLRITYRSSNVLSSVQWFARSAKGASMILVHRKKITFRKISCFKVYISN